MSLILSFNLSVILIFSTQVPRKKLKINGLISQARERMAVGSEAFVLSYSILVIGYLLCMFPFDHRGGD